MAYRNPNPIRMSAQSEVIRQFAGHVVTWKQYISGASGNAVVGIGDTLYYRQTQITAVMAFGRDNREPTREFQSPVGQFLGGEVYAVTREPIGTRDELVWNGVTYRVEAESVPSRIGNQWNTRLKRGE